MKFKHVRCLAVIFCIVCALFSFSGCKACNRLQWKQVYEAYTQGGEKFVFQTIKATIVDVDSLIENKSKPFDIVIDTDDFFEKYHEAANAQASINIYQRQGFYFVDESIENLEEAGFFNSLSADTVITFTVNNYIGWDGWQYPIFGVAIEETVYLDFDTGYENIINFVQYNINNP